MQDHSRSLRIAIDTSIWLFQAQAAQGGANPELRALFYRLARLVALPVHPIFVFDGPGRPGYKRGKLIARNGSAGGRTIRSAKRLIELFGFHCHDAPGEAEAECAKLQKEGVVDAALSNDIDTVMFGSKLTFMNFSKASSRSAGAATHVSVYRAEESGANVMLDRGGMVLFALLSGGDYLPAGVPKCGPKLAAEIARAGFGADLLDIIAKKSKELKPDLDEWRERLNYELSTNESGYFRSKHKAVQIPDNFPDLQVLFDYTNPMTSSTNGLRKLHTLQWDAEFNINALREFVSAEFGWTYLPGAIQLVRKLAPSLAAYNLRTRSKNSFQAQISGRKENLSMDGLAEFKLQFVPMYAVGLDLSSEQEPPSQTQNSDSDSESDPDNGHVDPLSSVIDRTYDATKSQYFWVFEALVTLGMPKATKAWYDEQEQKRVAALKPAPRRSSRKTKKVVDPGMVPGALHRYGTVSKPQAEVPIGANMVPAKSTAVKRVSRPNSSKNRRDSTDSRSQRTIADCAAFAVRSTKAKTSSFSERSKLANKRDDPTSSELEAVMTLEFSEEGRLLPVSCRQNDSNDAYSSARAMARLETDTEVIPISSSPSEEIPLPPSQTVETAGESKVKATEPLEETLGPCSTTDTELISKKPRVRSSDRKPGRKTNDTPKESSKRELKSALGKEPDNIICLDESSSDDAPRVSTQVLQSTTLSRLCEEDLAQHSYIDLASIKIGNGFWTYLPRMGSQSSERPAPASSTRVSILDMTKRSH